VPDAATAHPGAAPAATSTAAADLRLGILGGSFNPPHRGHLALARHAQRELALDRVLLVPTNRSPEKSATEDPGGEHRLRMCQLAIGDSPGLSVAALELQRAAPSYTVDTLRVLHAEHPHAQLTFILGADVARTLPAWREPRELLALAELAVALRAAAGDGSTESDPRELRHALAALPEARVRFLEMPPVAVSSSLVRERLARAEPVAELVGPAVAAYIDARGLYRAPLAPREPAGESLQRSAPAR
jgi:nicotinate-nucleotide adenylyltransferase